MKECTECKNDLEDKKFSLDKRTNKRFNICKRCLNTRAIGRASEEKKEQILYFSFIAREVRTLERDLQALREWDYSY